jgi:hypothetical protein
MELMAAAAVVAACVLMWTQAPADSCAIALPGTAGGVIEVRDTLRLKLPLASSAERQRFPLVYLDMNKVRGFRERGAADYTQSLHGWPEWDASRPFLPPTSPAWESVQWYDEAWGYYGYGWRIFLWEMWPFSPWPVGWPSESASGVILIPREDLEASPQPGTWVRIRALYR